MRQNGNAQIIGGRAKPGSFGAPRWGTPTAGTSPRVYGVGMPAILVMVFVAAVGTLMMISALTASVAPELLVDVDSRSLYQGEPFVYRVILNRVTPPREPHLEIAAADFDVFPLGCQLAAPPTVASGNSRMANVSSDAWQYSYQLTPRRSGVLTIPSPTLKVRGGRIWGPESTLNVAHPRQQDVVRMEIQSDRAAVYPMQPFTITLLVAVKAMPEPFSDRDPVGLRSDPPQLTIPWAADDQLPKGLQPTLVGMKWLRTVLDSQGQGFGLVDFGGDSVFGQLIERCPTFLPSPEKVLLPNKWGRPTTYWQYHMPRTFVAEQSAAIYLWARGCQRRFCHGHQRLRPRGGQTDLCIGQGHRGRSGERAAERPARQLRRRHRQVPGHRQRRAPHRQRPASRWP